MSESIKTVTQADETAPQPAEETVPATGTEQSEETEQAEVKEEDAPKPKAAPWFQKRIDELTRQRHEAERQLAAERAELARLRAGAQPQQQQPAPPPGYVPAELVQAKAAELLEQTRFVEECNAVAATGSEKFPDFSEAVDNISRLVDRTEQLNPLLQAVTELGREDGARVYYELGKNPEKAAALLAMPPAKMAVALARMAATPAKPVAVTKAPEPIRPIGSGGVRNSGPPDDPREYARWREEQLAKRNR